MQHKKERKRARRPRRCYGVGREASRPNPARRRSEVLSSSECDDACLVVRYERGLVHVEGRQRTIEVGKEESTLRERALFGAKGPRDDSTAAEHTIHSATEPVVAQPKPKPET